MRERNDLTRLIINKNLCVRKKKYNKKINKLQIGVARPLFKDNLSF
jgi:hypothetical protein